MEGNSVNKRRGKGDHLFVNRWKPTSYKEGETSYSSTEYKKRCIPVTETRLEALNAPFICFTLGKKLDKIRGQLIFAAYYIR